MVRVVRLMLVLVLVSLSARPVHATFHFMSISELGAGFLGNPNVQFVELRLDAAGQNNLATTRLTSFDKDGNAKVILVTPTGVANGGTGATVLYATTEFQTATGVTPDFIIAADVVGPSGMICWGAPGTASPADPATWDFDKSNNYVDCVAYGSYPHATRFASGTPTSLLPGDGTRSLTRAKNDSVAGSNDMDFVLAAASPCNNAGTCASLVPSPTPTATPSTPGKAQIACRRAVIKAGTKFAAAYLQAKVGCETQRLKGKVATCPDAKTTTKIASADAKRTKTIVKACGALTPGDAGFGGTCPGFTGDCTAPIASVADVSSCVGCGARRAGDELVATVYAAPADATFTKCQLAFGKAVAGHTRAVAALLARCEDGVARGKIVGACPDTKTAGRIAAKTVKLRTTLCKACGGKDKVCGGPDDAPPATLGVTTCPTRTVPGGSACGPITTGDLGGIVECGGCVASFASTCGTAFVAHPGTLPPSCSAP